MRGMIIADGPYLETKEHVDGLWVLEAANQDEALAWGRRSSPVARRSRGAPAPLREDPTDAVESACWVNRKRQSPYQTSD
ncbi:hypothetical protein ABH944_007834 [Caballeronia udeis]|uniref:YCII-related domain-containing protein n=2 Tax=Caballeronia udeis TaxID=1232866 RepID=A0ABW8MUP2_9BURK